MPAAHLQPDLAVPAFEQALQLGHALARDDDLALGLDPAFVFGLAQRQPVPVRRHAAKVALAQVEQQAVEVVPDILLGHREGRALDQLLQRGLGNGHPLGGLHFVDRREVIGRQRRQGEARAPGLDRDLFRALADRHPAAIREGPDDVEELPRGDGGLSVPGVLHRDPGDHLDFQVGTRQRQLPVADLYQEVGQHREGLATFDHVDDLRQRLEKHFALQAETHSVLPLCPVLRECINQKLGGGGAVETAGKLS